MHKPFYTWTNFFRRLGLKPKRTRRPAGLKPRSLRLEPLAPREMLAGDVLLSGFYGDGGHLVVKYDVVGEDAQPFEVGIYRSTGDAAAETLVASARVSKPADLAAGTGHSLAINAALADLEADYVLLAKIQGDSKPGHSAASEVVQWEDMRVFDGGAFLAPDGALHVHGTAGDDQVAVAVADSGGVRVRLNGVWYAYKPHEVSSVHIRTHQGDDIVATSALVTAPVWVFGGEGNDYVLGGSGDDLVVGGAGDDRLYGGPGNDILVGGEGNDYLHGGQGDDIIHGGAGENTLIAAAGEDVVWGGTGQQLLDARSATTFDAVADEDGLAEALLVAGGERSGLLSPSDATSGSQSPSRRLAWLDDSLAGTSGFGVAVDQEQGGSPLKRELPVSGAATAVAGSQAVGVAGDHTGGGPFLKRETPVEEQEFARLSADRGGLAGLQGVAAGKPASGKIPVGLMSAGGVAFERYQGRQGGSVGTGRAEWAGKQSNSRGVGFAEAQPGLAGRQVPAVAAPSAFEPAPRDLRAPGQPGGGFMTLSSGSGSGSGSGGSGSASGWGSASGGSGSASGSGSAGGGSGSASGGIPQPVFQPPRHVLHTGYVVDPAVPFIPAEIGNYGSTIEDNTTRQESWEEGGITYTATIVNNSTLSITATFGPGNTWTYDESLVSSFTVTTTGSDGSTAYESGTYDYTFTASGTTDASGTVETTGYTFTANGTSSASGSVTQTYSSGGWSDTSTYQWTWSASFQDAVSNTTDLAAGSGSGSASGSGSTNFSYSASGSYSYSFDGGSASGTLSASGSDGMSYGYAITASCSGGQWSKAGNATVNENGTADYSHTGTGSYAASGSGSASSSGSGSASGGGSGVPFEFQWSYSGSLGESATQTSSYQGTTQFSLASEGTWQATAGSLSGSGSATWSYSASGSYSYSFDGGSVSGTFSASGSDGFSYQYSVSASNTGGQWTESGTASLTQTGSATATYGGSGSFAASGQASASGSGSGYSWSYGGTISENGSDQSSYGAATQLVLDAQGNWEPTTGSASGSGTNQWSYTWEGSYSYNGDGLSLNGSFTDSGNDAFSYGYAVTGNSSEGQWDETGTATVTLSGQNSFSYLESGSLALAGEGWTLTGSLMSSGSQDASWSYDLDLDLDSQGTWQATNGSGGSSGLGELHSSFTGSGNYSYALGDGNISGTFGLTTSEHVAPFMFSTSATYSEGQWSESGNATATATGQGNSSYTGTGTVGMSGQQWNASITVSENGNDSYLYLYTLGYVLDDQGAWTLDSASGGIGGSGLANWSYSAGGSYWYDVGLSTVIGDFSEFAEDHMAYSYNTTDTAAAGVWTHSGTGTWSDHGNGNRSFSANSPYTTADGYSGTVHENAYESFNYNYTGNPALDAQGNWYWSVGSGQSSGNGHWTFNRSGSKPYSRTDGQTYSVSGTRTENITDQLSYSYSTLAAVNAQGVWVVNGGATAQASGQATWAYSASGSFSSSSSSSGSSTTYSATTSENGSTGSGYNFSLQFELVDDTWLPTTGQGAVTATREEHFSHTGTRQTDEHVTSNNSGNSGRRDTSSTLTQGQTKDLSYQRTDHYLWAPGSAFGSGSGSGSASGSATSPWRLTQIEESGNATATRQLDYDYSGSGSSWSQWGDAMEGGSGSSSWYAVRSIHQESHSTESLNRTISFSASGRTSSSGSNVRSATAGGAADSFYDSEWEDHWWIGPESWASGGTWQNATYDDYNYQYQWTKVWVPEGEPNVTESVTNHVTGIENGTTTGWWTWSYAGGFGSGSGSGSGSSSSTSWGGSWSPSYDETVTYPGFYEGAYYATASGGYSSGGSPEEYFAYLGDAFSSGGGTPGSGGGMFPFAYRDEELLLQQGEGGSVAQQASTGEARAGGHAWHLVDPGGRQEHPGTAKNNADTSFAVAAAKRAHGSGEAVEAQANGEPSANRDRRLPEWRWWNPFTWFNWGVDWSEAVDQEIALVRQLNQTFGTMHTRLDQFTAEERAMIEQALGQKFNWEAASAIRASEGELRVRDKVLLGSQVSLVAAATADAAAAGCAAAGVNPWMGTAGIHGPHHGLATHAELILRVAPHRVLKVIVPGKSRWLWWGIK
ncbi:hypothetical protein JCM19992_21320 [Thermostilla marina]